MKYCIPDCIIMDEDSAFMSSLMNYLFSKFNIKIKMVAPYNHQSLQAEQGIKSLLTILTNHLTNLSQMWPKYLSLSMFAYNTFNTSNIVNYRSIWISLWEKTKNIMQTTICLPASWKANWEHHKSDGLVSWHCSILSSSTEQANPTWMQMH